jgi:hypothetical protein
MPIIRRKLDFERKEFTQIPNSWLRDERLSLKSKGLLAQLISHSVGWSMTISALCKANNCGYHTIASCIQELESSGYLVRIQQKDDKGRFGETLWFLSDPKLPPLENPTSENPTSENPMHKNTNVKNTKEKNSNPHVFDQFWDLYPRKVGKASARKVFTQLHEGDRAKAMEGVRKLRQDPNLPPTEFIPHPTTWLNREGWDDDPYPKRELKPWERPADIPGKDDWKAFYHDQDDHTFCNHD